MLSLSVLFDLPGISLDQLDVDPKTVTIEAHVEASEAACPLCQTLSQRVHSHYTRTLHDVPCGIKALRLVVQVRRFFCENQDCPRKIFAERLPALTEVSARMTTRYRHGLAEVGFVLGGRAGAKMGARLGWRESRSTILRTLRRLPKPQLATPRLLGVDDWAFRRGSSYGTLLLDLETHEPVDLLAGRQAETLASWLVAHPGVQLISRDRAGEYAQGAKKGVPESIQVADRFHLTKNLSESWSASCHIIGKPSDRSAMCPPPRRRPSRWRCGICARGDSVANRKSSRPAKRVLSRSGSSSHKG